MRFITLSVLTLSVLLFVACDPAKPVSISERQINKNRFPGTNLPMPPSKPIEELGWTNFDTKKEVKLEDMKGKVLVLDFWATYCPPCIKAIPHLKELQAKYGEDGFQVVGLHVGGEEDAPNIPTFMKRLKIDYPIATPEDELTYALLSNDNRIPQTLIFNREGKMVKKFVSYDDTIKQLINKTIENTMKKDLK